MKIDYLEKDWRIGVGIVLLNSDKEIFVGERIDNRGAWQMPQGGVNISINESLENASKRELYEETGIKNVILIKESSNWYYYKLPDKLKNKLWKGKFIGQKQKWFLYDFKGKNEDINIKSFKKPEFCNWKWAPPEEVYKIVVSFKREIYYEVLEEFKEYFI